MNSEFSFSKTGCHMKVKELCLSDYLSIAEERIPFSSVSVLCEMKTALFRMYYLSSKTTTLKPCNQKLKCIDICTRVQQKYLPISHHHLRGTSELKLVVVVFPES